MKPRRNQFLTRDAPNLGESLTREFELDRASVNENARTVELSFSSEAGVMRYFGEEVLDHSTGAVRLGRLRNGGALLINHDTDDQVGVVESVTLGADRKGRAVVRFGRSARANEIFQDVQDGIRRLVSVGYRIHRTETTQRAGQADLVRVLDWEPYEISLVSIPADESVGVGRNDNSPQSTSNTPTSQPSNPMNRDQLIAALRAAGIAFRDEMTDDQLRGLLPAQSPAPTPASERSAPAPAPRIEVVREAPPREPTIADAMAAERRRVADIQAIAEQVRSNGGTLDSNRAIADGITPDAFRTQALEALIARQTHYAPGGGGGDGLSRQDRRDIGQFSILRGLSAMLDNSPLTGIEAEMQQEARREAQRSGVALTGNFHIPGLVLNAGRRDMTATGGTGGDQGGTTIATNQGSLIELLYPKLVLRGLGAQFLTGLVGNIDLPKLVTGSTVANKAENGAGDESSPTTGKLTLSPKRATTFVEISRQLMIQGTPSAEAYVRNDLMTALALIIEARAINGSGSSNQPTGILATSGIGSVVGGTNGLAPTWAHIIGLETEVAVDNADVGSLGYLTNTKVRGKLKSTSKVSGQNGFVWDDGETPLNGYRAGVTNQVPFNLTKGSSSGVASAIIFGNFNDLILAQWGGLDLMLNPYAKDTEGLVRITLNAYHDNLVRRPESFAAMVDALTT